MLSLVIFERLFITRQPRREVRFERLLRFQTARGQPLQSLPNARKITWKLDQPRPRSFNQERRMHKCGQLRLHVDSAMDPSRGHESAPEFCGFHGTAEIIAAGTAQIPERRCQGVPRPCCRHFVERSFCPRERLIGQDRRVRPSEATDDSSAPDLGSMRTAVSPARSAACCRSERALVFVRTAGSVSATPSAESAWHLQESDTASTRRFHRHLAATETNAAPCPHV